MMINHSGWRSNPLSVDLILDGTFIDVVYILERIVKLEYFGRGVSLHTYI